VTYWIFVTSEKNWKVIRDEKVWGMPLKRENLIKKLKVGDEAFIYLKQEKKGDEVLPSRIVGLFEIASEAFKSSEQIFKDRSYPWRVKLRPKIVLKDKYLEFKPLLAKLKFTKGAKGWAAYLRSGMAQIPEEDYRLIEAEIRKLS